MSFGLKRRIEKLERTRKKKRHVNIHALEYPVDASGSPSPELEKCLSTPCLKLKNAPKGILERYSGVLNNKVILVPCFGSDEEWEAAAIKQQTELKHVSRH